MTSTTPQSVPDLPELSVAERTFRKTSTLQQKILCWFCELHPEERAMAMEGTSEHIQDMLRREVFRYRSQIQLLRDTLDEMRDYGKVEVQVNPHFIFKSIRFDTIETFCPRTALDVIASYRRPTGKPIVLPLQSAFDWNGEVDFRRKYTDKNAKFYSEGFLTWKEEEDYSQFMAGEAEKEAERASMYSETWGSSWEDADQTVIA